MNLQNSYGLDNVIYFLIFAGIFQGVLSSEISVIDIITHCKSSNRKDF